MKRSLFSQMRVEWRSNLWMIIELAIVGLVIVFIAMVMAWLISTKSGPVGYDLDDIYVGSVNYLRSDANVKASGAEQYRYHNRVV